MIKVKETQKLEVKTVVCKYGKDEYRAYMQEVSNDGVGSCYYDAVGKTKESALKKLAKQIFTDFQRNNRYIFRSRLFRIKS